MIDIKEPLIPVVGELLPIFVDTPDVKTFRVVTPTERRLNICGSVCYAFYSRCR